MDQTIIVVGAGVVGASVAHALALRGAPVTVIDRGLPGAGASAASFGWINASFAETADYFRLRTEALAEYDALEAEMGAALGLCRGGSVWWEEEGDLFDAHVATMQAYGADADVIGPGRVTELAPMIAAPPERAFHAPGESAIDGRHLAGMLLSRAVSHGARMICGADVRAVAERGGRVAGVETDAGFFSAARVVVAAGGATGVLAGSAGVTLPLKDPPGLILHTLPVEFRLRTLVLAPDVHVRQGADGSLIAGETHLGAGRGRGRISTDPAGLADDILGRVRALFARPDVLAARVMIGRRPVPADGLPAVGAAGPDGLYLAVMHSGVTLGPLIGRLAAGEVLGGAPDPRLAPYRPGRFAPGAVPRAERSMDAV